MATENSGAQRAKKAQRAGLKPYPKGVSGNPGGRPRGAKEVMDAIRDEHLPEKVPNVMRRLYTQAVRGNVMAIREYLDRILGKATQAIEVSGPGGNPVSIAANAIAQMTSEQKRLELAALLATPAASTASQDDDGTSTGD